MPSTDIPQAPLTCHMCAHASDGPQGVVRPGLERLCESYRTKASQLGQDLVSLREQCGARAEAVNERKEDMAGLETQVGADGMSGRRLLPAHTDRGP